MLSREDFDKRISQIPGVKDDGHGNWVGIRLLTSTEQKERKENATKIQRVICRACGADERSCSSECLLVKKHLAQKIAAMIPVGVQVTEPKG